MLISTYILLGSPLLSPPHLPVALLAAVLLVLGAERPEFLAIADADLCQYGFLFQLRPVLRPPFLPALVTTVHLFSPARRAGDRPAAPSAVLSVPGIVVAVIQALSGLCFSLPRLTFGDLSWRFQPFPLWPVNRNRQPDRRSVEKLHRQRPVRPDRDLLQNDSEISQIKRQLTCRNLCEAIDVSDSFRSPLFPYGISLLTFHLLVSYNDKLSYH